MKKSDLKNGMVVELRKKTKFIVLGECLFNNMHEYSLGHYNNDLGHINDIRVLDIVKIYTIGDEFKLKDMFNEDGLEVIWERKEVDWSEVPVGTEVLVSDNKNNWYEHLFINYRYDDEEFKFKAIDKKSRQIHNWKYCKLAEEPKEEVTKGELKKEYLDFMEPEFNGYNCDEEEIECLTEWLLYNYNVTRK